MATFEEFKKAVMGMPGGGGGTPDRNYTPTKDPNVYMGKNGVPITRAQFEQNQKSSMPFTNFETYADWVGGWAKKAPTAMSVSPYYRHYGNGQNIPGGNIAILQAKYQNDPKVQEILNRNIAKPGDVPMFSPDDGDAIKKLISAM